MNTPIKKYAVMWASTINIGDDIQTLAAIEFLKHHNINEYTCIDREALKSYNGEPVTLIMNGWFMWKLEEFPPSNKITPVFISFHCANELLIKNNIEYFKKYEPIGCRDTHTLRLFEKYNIKAYFTGCLTLIFEPYTGLRNENILVDADINDKNMTKYSNYSIINHTINNNLRYDNKKKLAIAIDLLNKYRKASNVITSRLHCTLPCRAFGTPVKMVHKNYNLEPRFTGLKQFLNGSSNLDECKDSVDKSLIDERRNFFINYKLE